jgi:molybdopterin-guanine dinucleotide biosynthesis protein A
MPCLDPSFIEYMLTQAENAEIVCPKWSRGREPLHAIYSKGLIPEIKTLLEKKSLKIFNLLKEANTLFIDENTIRKFNDPEEIFANINTIEDISRMPPIVPATIHE